MNYSQLDCHHALSIQAALSYNILYFLSSLRLCSSRSGLALRGFMIDDHPAVKCLSGWGRGS